VSHGDIIKILSCGGESHKFSPNSKVKD